MRYQVALRVTEEEYKLINDYFTKHPELKVGVTLGKFIIEQLKSIASSGNQ